MLSPRELIVFNMYKDKSFLSSKDFKKQTEKFNINSTNVYANIVKYQLNKYGKQLILGKDKLTKEECKKISKNRYISNHRKIGSKYKHWVSDKEFLDL